MEFSVYNSNRQSMLVHTLVLVLEKQRQVNPEMEAGLVYKECPRTSRGYIVRPRYTRVYTYALMHTYKKQTKTTKKDNINK